MPELKRTFTGGKMEKDLDERIVPNGQYREALNIGVATSEDSDVGAAQNILGNIQVSLAISSLTEVAGTWGNEHVGHNYHVASIVDKQTDLMYRFIHTPNKSEYIWMDRIIEFDTSKSLEDPWEEKEKAVMVDIFKVQAEAIWHNCICIGSNQHEIMVKSLGSYGTDIVDMLRWGMKVSGGGEFGNDVTIEKIDYVTKIITLNKPVWQSVCPDGNGAVHYGRPTLTFTGDRNLNFSPGRKITGLNIIDGMIFWTDNYSEPKKINIDRCRRGSDSSQEGAWPGRGQKHINDFNQHTFLIVKKDSTDFEKVLECGKDEHFCPPVGCTNPLAFNYDPLALYDDGSCCLNGGCTDDNVDANGDYIHCNYDPDACFDDGSCCVKCGCTDPAYCNYDPMIASGCDDGSCAGIVGCMDPSASNYNPNADCDDGCVYNYKCYPDGYNQDYCGHSVLNGFQFTPPSNYTYLTANGSTYSIPWASNVANINDAQLIDTQYIEADGQEGSNYQNVNQNYGTYDMAMPFGEYVNQPMSGDSSLSIGHWKHYVIQDATPFTTAMTTDGTCNYPLDSQNWNAGHKVKVAMNALLIPGMWGNNSAGTAAFPGFENGSPTGTNSIPGIDGMDYNTWINSTSRPGLIGGIPGNTPAPDWYPGSGHYYESTTPNIFNGANIEYGSQEMWSYTACFGLGCQDAGYQTDGWNWEDVITFLRANGFDGNGPSIGAAAGMTGTEKIMKEYHGMGAWMGTATMGDVYTAISANDFSQVPGGMSNSSHFTFSVGWALGNANVHGTYADGTLKYNYGQFPEVTSTMTFQEVYSKVVNNKQGWAMIGWGDIPVWQPWMFVQKACNCGNYSNIPYCDVTTDPLGPNVFADQYDCENCSTCDCNPINVSWDCINGSCIQVQGLGGMYPDQATCNTHCVSSSGS